MDDLKQQAGPANRPALHEYDYQLIIPFPNHIKEKITRLRQEFASKFGSAPPRTLFNHLTLAYWTGRPVNEDRLHQHLHLISMGAAPFQVILKNYGFEPSHRIFIHVATKAPFVQLGKQLKTTQPILQASPGKSPHFIVPETITLAQKLLPWQFEKGQQAFAHRQFNAKFIASQLFWLKRKGPGEAWQIMDRLHFQNLSVSINHGQLFAA